MEGIKIEAGGEGGGDNLWEKNQQRWSSSKLFYKQYSPLILTSSCLCIVAGICPSNLDVQQTTQKTQSSN